MNSTGIKSLKQRLSFTAIGPLVVASVVMLWVGTASASPPLFVKPTPRIAIDPGHGGGDTGAKGPTGHLEKTAALDLARLLSSKLEPAYDTLLTRGDDYNVDLRQRAAIANQAKADLLISIHTGAAFMHGPTGLAVYYYRPVQTPVDSSPDSLNASGGQRWEDAQIRHKAASLSLAKALNEYLGKAVGPGKCKIQMAPLKVLEGANMAAVLVEAGYITHPATEKRLISPQGLDQLASALKEGIVHYLETSAQAGRTNRQPAGNQ